METGPSQLQRKRAGEHFDMLGDGDAERRNRETGIAREECE